LAIRSFTERLLRRFRGTLDVRRVPGHQTSTSGSFEARKCTGNMRRASILSVGAALSDRELGVAPLLLCYLPHSCVARTTSTGSGVSDSDKWGAI